MATRTKTIAQQFREALQNTPSLSYDPPLCLSSPQWGRKSTQSIFNLRKLNKEWPLMIYIDTSDKFQIPLENARLVFASRDRTHRTSVGWGGGSSGHWPQKSCCLLEKNNLKTDSQRGYSGQNGWCIAGKEEFKTEKLKSAKQIFFPTCLSWRQSQKYSSHPRDFFPALWNIYRSPFIRYIPFQVSKVLVFWEAFLCHQEKTKRNSSFCWSPCDLTRCPPLELGSNNGDQLSSW